MSDQYHSLSPYTYCANNPIVSFPFLGKLTRLSWWIRMGKKLGIIGIGMENYSGLMELMIKMFILYQIKQV